MTGMQVWWRWTSALCGPGGDSTRSNNRHRSRSGHITVLWPPYVWINGTWSGWKLSVVIYWRVR